jgi:hypothetical protein
MSTFVLLAAVMAAIAAFVVASPLLRNRASRVLGALVAMLVMGAAAGLYPLWSNWNWSAPAQSQRAAAGPDVVAMVAKLEKRLHDEPGDLAGWLLLGRSYLALDRLDDAVSAYGHAHQLDGKSADAAMGLGEAMSLRAGIGALEPEGSLVRRLRSCRTRRSNARAHPLADAQGSASAGSDRTNARYAHCGAWPSGEQSGRRRAVRCDARWDECVAGGDEHVGWGLRSGRGHCHTLRCARLEGSTGNGGPLVRLCT